MNYIRFMLLIAILRPVLPRRVAGLCCVLMAFGGMPGVGIADVVGSAVVNQDGSLKVGKHLIRLYGIYLPPTDTNCRGFQQRCPLQAARVLDAKIQGFVRCVERGRNPDGTLSAACQSGYTTVSEGHDLAAFLLQQGWAIALPEAPAEYHLLEKIAYRRGMGIWGGEDFRW